MRRTNHISWRFISSVGVVLTALLSSVATVQGVSTLKRYEKAPPIDLKDLAGNRVTSESLKGRPAVLVFGELYNRNTLEALKELSEIRSSRGFDKAKIPVYLIVAQDIAPTELRDAQEKNKVEAIVLHDRSRSAFGAFGVLVLPSTVVLDPEGNVCTAISGYPLAFGDMMTDALLYALGKTTREQFEAAGRASSRPVTLDEGRLRAGRLAGLARQLLRRGHAELALERYEQALKLDKDYLPARIGLARCLIRLKRLADATEQLQKALKADQKNLEANLAMAYVEYLRGGEEIKAARERLNRVLILSPHNPEAHYLMGLIHETEKELDKALTEFKKAAEILLETRLR